jgi:hypothetical protein
LKLISAQLDKHDVIIRTNKGNFRCEPDGFITGPDVRPDAARHQISPTTYWVMFGTNNWKCCPPNQQQRFEVSEEWCDNLSEIKKAAALTGNFNR